MKYFIIILTLILLIAGCSRPPEVIYDQPDSTPVGYYEKAWVEPSIIMSDSLVSLIRSDRVDSFLVSAEEVTNSADLYSLSFQIETDQCMGFIWLIDSKGKEYLKLVDRLLNYGYYKFNFNPNKLSDSTIPATDLFLKAEFCGNSIIEPVRR